jgi:hypothetical protein
VAFNAFDKGFGRCTTHKGVNLNRVKFISSSQTIPCQTILRQLNWQEIHWDLQVSDLHRKCKQQKVLYK